MRVVIRFYADSNSTPEIQITLEDKAQDFELVENFCFDNPNDAATALVMCIRIAQALGAKMGRDAK